MNSVKLPCQKCGYVWEWASDKSPEYAICPKGFGCSKVTKQENWNELQKQIERFRSFKERTGASKSSSYSVSINFDGYNDTVYVEFGGYDVGGWSRHESLETTQDYLVRDFTFMVDLADKLTEHERYCPLCKEYTEHDVDGNCLGYFDWGEEVKCKGQDDE